MKIRDLTHFVWGAWYLFCIWFWFISPDQTTPETISTPMVILVLLSGLSLLATSMFLIFSLMGIVHDNWDK